MGTRRTLVRARQPAGAVIGGVGGGGWGGNVSWPAGAGVGSWPVRDVGVSAGEVLGLPAFNRGKNLIGGIIAQLPLIDRRDDGTEWPLNAMLDDPWPVMSAPEWWSYQTDAIIMTGDAMAIPADYDADGYPRQLVPIDPRAVVVRLEDGQVLYDLFTDLGVITLTRSEVWHAKGLTLTSDGLRGVGVVTQFRVALGMGQALQRYGIATFQSSGVPSGIIKVQLRNVSDAQATQVKNDWMSLFRDRSPAVLSQLMDFTPISWSPLDAQYLEQRRFNVADIAFSLNLDPTDLDATVGSSMTYANREQRSYDRLLTSIGPYLSRFEKAYRFLIPRGHHPTFDRSVLLWSDAATRASVQHQQLEDGTLTINEARGAEGRPLFGSWADEPWGKPPSEEPPPPPALPPVAVLPAVEPGPSPEPVPEPVAATNGAHP